MAYVLTFKSFVYFLVAPTLCFQLYYPRTLRIRKWFLAKRVFEFVFCAFGQCFCLLQFIIPTLVTAPQVFDINNLNFTVIVSFVFKLALPCTLAWLLGFLYVFHAGLNIIGELLYFGDREFYKEWWNCRNLGEYWRTWNMPVHNFFVRHVMQPFVSKVVLLGV